MKYLEVPFPKGKYLADMKDKRDSVFSVFDARITGIVLGPFFAVAHHMPWEWNRKITGECNRAYGFVTEKEGKTKIHYFRSFGQLSLGWLLTFILIIELMGGLELGWTGLAVSAGLSLLVCGLSSLGVLLTENGQIGAAELEQFLKNPEEYFP